MADQTPDPTAWSDGQLDNLLDALAERAAERDDLDLPGSGSSRRTVLATLLGAGGFGVAATQLGAAAQFGSATGTVGTQSSPVDIANIRDLDAKLLETEQFSVSNETFTRYNRNSTSNSTVRSEFINMFDSVEKSTTGEGANGQITPNESGEYLIITSPVIFGNTANGDQIRARVRNVTDGVNAGGQKREKASDSTAIPTFVFVANLTAGKTYEPQVTNEDNSFQVSPSGDTTGVVTYWPLG